MPILTAAVPTTAPPAARATPQGVVQSPSQWAWTSSSGTTRSLTNGVVYLRPGGVAGHESAPITPRVSLPPSLDGGLWRGQRADPRDVALALMVSTSTVPDYRAAVRQLVADLDTSDAAGVLTVAHADGDQRMLSCRYVSGLEAPQNGDPGVIPVASFVVQLRAYDPWWYGPPQQRVYRAATTEPLWPTGGGPPFTIMPTELIGSGSTIDNPGDVESFPVWTLHGPMTQAVVTAQDGASFTVTRTLLAGQSVVVDCDPRAPAFAKVVDDTGGNLWGVATGDYPDLWALPAGQSTVTVDMSGTTSESSVVLQFNPRYRTA